MREFRSAFEHTLLRETEKIVKIQALYRWRHSENVTHKQSSANGYDEISKDEQREKISHLLSIAHHSDDYVSNCRKLRELREKSILKLTRNFKIRIQESMAEFSVGDKQACKNKIEGSMGIREAEEDE